MASAKRVGANIKAWRGIRDLTQVELGEAIGSDGPRLGRLESGKENPTLETLDKLAAALKIDVHQLTSPRPEENPGHDAIGGGGGGGNAGLADSLRRAIVEYEQTGEAPKDWRGDVLIAIFALTRAMQRPADTGKSHGVAAKAK